MNTIRFLMINGGENINECVEFYSSCDLDRFSWTVFPCRVIGDLPVEDPDDGTVLRADAGEAPESPPVAGPLHPVLWGGPGPGPALWLLQQQGPSGAAPPAGTGSRPGPVLPLWIRWSLLWENLERNQSEHLVAKCPAGNHRICDRLNHHGN